MKRRWLRWVITFTWSSHAVPIKSPRVHHFLTHPNVKCWIQIFPVVMCSALRVVWLRTVNTAIGNRMSPRNIVGGYEIPIYCEFSSVHIPIAFEYCFPLLIYRLNHKFRNSQLLSYSLVISLSLSSLNHISFGQYLMSYITGYFHRSVIYLIVG